MEEERGSEGKRGFSAFGETLNKCLHPSVGNIGNQGFLESPCNKCKFSFQKNYDIFLNFLNGIRVLLKCTNK